MALCVSVARIKFVSLHGCEMQESLMFMHQLNLVLNHALNRRRNFSRNACNRPL